ncbi:molybdopterin converting factor subunit 1 [Halalkalibacter akibai]|uniref:Molybdopterin synthase sulfur carrier subunit n=1 Tax=Halalkalibacter akibai (strain ATCC 43226 / DSM 21942 / CIP 109018 / JCM 9157 / 1139) TaxID=1236973 RepID=W4QY24_HALA3|nr:molybdopterin converting factor subunit 1 [Halalkalibacter akibai]GAE36224.1 molybdenum cofactor biosynthesis protein MoaD [Halalkalibacter akibai JCM 9157]
MIKILLFAELQEQTGLDEISVDKAGLTVSELKTWLMENYELPTLNNSMIAINESYASETDRLKDGDIIAFIPPVSGG